METEYVSMTMRDYLKVIFRQKAIIITSFLTVMATVAVGLQMRTPQYEAKVKMIISAEKLTESPYYRELAGYGKSEMTLTQSEIVNSSPVIDRVVKAVGLYQRPLNYEISFASRLKKPLIEYFSKKQEQKFAGLTEDQKKEVMFRLAVEDLRQHIKVEPIRDTNLFTITVRDYSPLGAALLVNIVSRSYVIFDLEQQIADVQLKYGEKHLSVIQLKDSIEKMIKNLNGKPLPVIEAIGPASVKIIEQANIPLEPIGPAKVLILVLAFFMSIFLGVMLAFTFEYMDQTFKSPQEVESLLNVPFLGSIPHNSTMHNYHAIADQVYLLMKDKKLKTLLVTAALRKEGVTATATNIGTYLSKSGGHKVLIIDANLRNPSVYKFPKSGEGIGLAEILEEKASFESVVKVVNTELSVLPAGKTLLNPITLLASQRMRDLLAQAREKYEIVLVDGPELSNYKDSVMLAGQVDAVAVVITEGRTRKQVVKSLLEPLAEKKVFILGAILNNRTYSIPKIIYERV